MSEPATPPLNLSGIWKRYPGVDALKGVNFTVQAGEIHALLGENGAGKTTLVGVASGSIAPDEGQIEVHGSIVPRMTPFEALRLDVAIVHQEPALLPDLTVLENLVLGVPRQFRGYATGASGTGPARPSIAWGAPSTSMCGFRTSASRTAS